MNTRDDTDAVPPGPPGERGPTRDEPLASSNGGEPQGAKSDAAQTPAEAAANGAANGTAGAAEAKEGPAVAGIEATREEQAWLAALISAGFTPAEASRLIFERKRPREEGLRRAT